MTDFLSDVPAVDVDEARSARAVQFLIDSATQIGLAKADVIFCENRVKRVLAIARSLSDGKSIQARDDDARKSEQAEDAEIKHQDAVVRYETLKAQRDAAEALIEFWRSKNANQRGAERGMR